jgi:hypothetical protein
MIHISELQRKIPRQVKSHERYEDIKMLNE